VPPPRIDALRVLLRHGDGAWRGSEPASAFEEGTMTRRLLVGVCVMLALSLGLAAGVDAQRPGSTGGQGLAAQLEALQTQVTSLQTQVDALAAAVAPDDGTAAALVGTWTGPGRSVEFVRPVKPGPWFEPFFLVDGAPQYSFYVPNLDGGARTIGVNPEYLLARPANDPTPLTFALTRDGVTLSGMVSQGGVEVARLRGLVLGNNFFLLRACVMHPDGPSGPSAPCPLTGSTTGPVVIYQGVGSLNRDRNRILVTGTAIEAEGEHVVFNLALTKTP